MAANTLLQLTFKRADGKNMTMSIANPRAGLTVEEVNTAMAGIISKNIFAPDNVSLIAKAKAELVVTDTTAFTISQGVTAQGRSVTARKADLATDAILKLLPVSGRLKQLLTELGEEEGPAD